MTEKKTETTNESRDGCSRNQSGLEWVAIGYEHMPAAVVSCATLSANISMGGSSQYRPQSGDSAGVVGIRHVGRKERCYLAEVGEMIHLNFSAFVVGGILFHFLNEDVRQYNTH